MDHTTEKETEQQTHHRNRNVNFQVDETIRIRRESDSSSQHESISEEVSVVRNINIFLDPEELADAIDSWVGGVDDGGYNHHNQVDDFVSSSSSSSENSNNKFCSHKTFDIFLEILSLGFTMCDMSFVGILVYRHYMADEDPLQAWAMLLPIFLSTFGVQLFFEKYPPSKSWYNEILNIPLVGPILW